MYRYRYIPRVNLEMKLRVENHSIERQHIRCVFVRSVFLCEPNTKRCHSKSIWHMYLRLRFSIFSSVTFQIDIAANKNSNLKVNDAPSLACLAYTNSYEYEIRCSDLAIHTYTTHKTPFHIHIHIYVWEMRNPFAQIFCFMGNCTT